MAHCPRHECGGSLKEIGRILRNAADGIRRDASIRKLDAMSARVVRRAGAVRPGAQLKLAMPVPQPTPWTQTVWTPSISGAMSFSETTIFAVKDSWLPSPCR